MKIYIMTDMEGIGGVLNRNQVMSDQPYYEKTREWLTADVNAAVQGAIDGGADEVVVCDGHGANSAVNLLYDKLHEGATYIQGSPWEHYLQGIDDGVDGLFQVGAHAMAGTKGAILEHTMNSREWFQMRVNGQEMGEIGLCAAIAGQFEVPFIMVSGDDKACAESQCAVPDVQCAVVKYGISRHCARLLPKPVVHDLIQAKAKSAVKKARSIKPFKVAGPVEIEIDYFRTEKADAIREREGVEKLSALTVRYTAATVLDAFTRVLGG